jgi:hypothetical protein
MNFAEYIHLENQKNEQITNIRPKVKNITETNKNKIQDNKVKNSINH